LPSPKRGFHTDYLAGATAAWPKQATVLVANPSFAGKSGFGWTLTGKWGNQRYNGAAEVWHSTGFDLTQTLHGLPDGDYTLTCQLVNGEGQHTAYLYATSGAVTKQAVVTQSCAASNFDAERDKMAANPAYGKLVVEATVTGGTLTVGIKEPSDATTWLVFDTFTLTYKGATSAGLEKTRNQQRIHGTMGLSMTCKGAGLSIPPAVFTSCMARNT
jgi:hypothetical protein